MKIILQLLIVLFLILACQSTMDVNNEDSESISISIPEKAIGYWNAMDYFSEYEIIPLETTETSLIRTIKKVIVLEDRIIVFDSSGKKILFFDKKGKHLHSIDKKGDGPGELLQPQDICFNENNGSLSVYDKNNGLIIYDLDGQLISQEKDLFEKVPTKNFFDILSFERISDNEFLFRREVPGNGDGHESGKKLYIGNFHHVTDSFLNYSKDNFSNNNLVYTHYFSPFDSGYNFWEIFVDTLYYVNYEDKQLRKKYYFDFGNRSIAAKVSNTPLAELLTFIQENGEDLSGMPRNIVEFQDKLFFTYTYDLTNENAKIRFAELDKDARDISVFEGIRISDKELTFKELQFKVSQDEGLAFVNPLDLFENENSHTFLKDHPDIRESDNPILILLSR